MKKEIIEQAIIEQKIINDIKDELKNPFLSQDEAQHLNRKLNMANIYNISEAHKRGYGF